MKELTEALEQFAAAAANLSRQWELVGREELAELYPFTKSFDEVVWDIDAWTEAHGAAARNGGHPSGC